MKRSLVFEKWVGGKSESRKEGPADSFAYSQHLDFRKDPRLLSVLPKTVAEYYPDALITDMIQLPSGKYCAIDSAGGVYFRSTGGTWSKQGTTLPNTAYGMVYNDQQDTIYIPGTINVHSVTNADQVFGGTITVNANAFMAALDLSVTTGHANTYTTPTTYTEASTDRLTITPTIEPLAYVQLWVTSKGSGDLTVTMHDAVNNNLGSVTLPNASITAGAYNTFTFTTPPRMLVKPNAATYHFHVTVSGGTASTIGTATSSDFSTTDYTTYSNRLVSPRNGFHPVYEFLQYLVILNERYLAVWEPISQSNPLKAEFQSHRLVFPSGYQGTSACLVDEYIVVAAEKRSSSATNEFQKGKLLFWDGTSVSYNRVVDVPEGAPYGLFSVGNIAYYFANGKLWACASTGNPAPIYQMPFTDTEYTSTSTYSVNYPHTMDSRNGILLMGFPSETSSTVAQHAIYSYGRRNKNYSESFGYSYSIPTLNNTNTTGTLRIGMIKSFGDKLFLAYRDDSQVSGQKFGVALVDPNSSPFATATHESLIVDNSRPDKTKQAVTYRMTFTALPINCTITPKYKIDRGSWVTDPVAGVGDTEVLMNINKRYKEIQLGFDMTVGATTPEIISQVLIWETLTSEVD